MNAYERLKARFDSATSCEEMLKAFCEMATSGLFTPNEIASAHLKLNQKIVESGYDDPAKFIFPSGATITEAELKEFFESATSDDEMLEDMEPQVSEENLVSSGGTTGKDAEIKQAFYAATSADAMLRAFQSLEPHVGEENLGMECFILTRKLFDERKDWEKVRSYGERALEYFVGREHCNETEMMVAKTTRMLGAACRELKRFDESLRYLNQSSVIVSKLEAVAAFPTEVSEGKFLAHRELVQLKYSTEKHDEAMSHFKTMLEIQDKMTPGSVELGKENNVLAVCYLAFGRFKEAFPLVLKTVETYDAKRLANDPAKLALLKKSLGMMYCEMKEYGNALWSKLVQEMESANMLLLWGKSEEGEGALKAMISQDTAQGADFARASASVALARALCNKEKFSDATKYLKFAQGIVETKQINPVVLASVLENSLKMYKEMEEIETYGGVKSCDQEILKVLEAYGINADGTIGGVVKKMRDMASGGGSR